MADEEELEGVEIIKKRERPARKVTIRNCDMPKTLTDEVVEIAQQVLDEALDTPGQPHKDIAQRIKARLDKDMGGTWHAIVGSHFGGNVTNDAATLMNFQIDRNWYLVFRSGPPEKNTHHS